MVEQKDLSGIQGPPDVGRSQAELNKSTFLNGGENTINDGLQRKTDSGKEIGRGVIPIISPEATAIANPRERALAALTSVVSTLNGANALSPEIKALENYVHLDRIEKEYVDATDADKVAKKQEKISAVVQKIEADTKGLDDTQRAAYHSWYDLGGKVLEFYKGNTDSKNPHSDLLTDLDDILTTQQPAAA